MISAPSPINGTVYCVEDFLADQLVIGVRSTESSKEVLSISRVDSVVLQGTQNVVDKVLKKVVDDALIEHSVYWNSRLWC